MTRWERAQLVGERLHTLAEARQRYCRLTIGAVKARLYGSQKWEWFVSCARRHSGNVGRKGFRMLVEGPFPTRVRADVRARELRLRRCYTHEDCIKEYELARACFASQEAA